MSTGDKTSPSYDESKATVKFDPLEYSQSQDYKSSLDQIKKLIGNNSTQALSDTGTSYVQNVMGKDYSAYTPEQQQQMINDQTKTAREQFATDENRIASHLATSGLAGSGVSGMDWGGQQSRENKAVADIVSNIGNQNIEATRSDKSQALGLIPSLASVSQIPLQNQMQYSNILGQNDTAKNSWNQWNSQMGQAAQTTNSGAYQDWFNQAANEASKNQNALGNVIGKGGGKG